MLENSQNTQKNSKPLVAVGLSGGVDSAVAAYLLKQQGYPLIGMFMINWHDTQGTLSGSCPWEEDVIFAQLVARRLEIPFHQVDLSEQYRKRVVDYMFAEYSAGRTPNPDVLCNREIKFDSFAEAAFSLGAQLVATGHYCRKDSFVNADGERVYQLLAGKDGNKDQSYFLCQLSQKQLSTALFPIGELQKSEVRKIADENNLAPAHRKDSQGICFVGKVDLPVFLQQKLAPKDGDIIEIPADAAIFNQQKSSLDELSQPFAFTQEMGKIVGRHNGAHYFTIGQRKGLGVGGKEFPLFVIQTDTRNNVIYVGQSDQHPGLYRAAIKFPPQNVHFIRPDLEIKEGEDLACKVRIRYRQPLQDAVIIKTAEAFYIKFDVPQRGVTSGQFAAVYLGEELVMSAIIE